MKFIDTLKIRFFKSKKPSNHPITLTHKRIFILPTQRGLAFVGLIALLLLIAFIYNNNLVYALAFLLFGIFFTTILHSFKSINGLTVRQGRSNSVFAQEHAQFSVYVENQTVLPRYSLNFKSEQSTLQQLDIPPNSIKQVILTTKTEKRGWHELGIITLSCEFPLGLFHTWSLLYFDLKVLVYPTPSSVQIPFPENTNDPSQVSFAKPKLGDEDFYGLIPYQAGNSIKKIHWKAYAKGLGLFTKQYSGDSVSTDIWLDYEQTHAQNSEARLSQLCRWIIDAEKLGVRYGFKLGDYTLQPNNGESHAKKCLDALALF